MPARVQITTTADGVLTREVPVSHWLAGELIARIRIPASAGEVTRVEIDPDRGFPDEDRSNNLWEHR
jgi:hypothetical protein